MSPIFHLRKLLGSSRAGTSPPVATELPAFLPILRVRIIQALYPRLLNTPLRTINLLTLLTFILFLYPLPSSNRRMAFPLLIIFLRSPHSRRPNPFHRHLRSSCLSVTPRRLFLLCRFPSTRQERLYLRLGLTAPCPLSPLRTHTLANFLCLFPSHPRPRHMPLPQGHSRLTRLTRLLRLRKPRTSASLRHPNKMVHKSRLPRRASVHVVTVAQVGVRASADRHSVVVASRRACSSLPAAAGTGTYLRFLRPHFAEGLCCLHCRDECRFPHVLPDGHVVGRGGGRFRSPPQSALNGNGQATLEENLAHLSITEVSRFTARSSLRVFT
jgi:hypothetical protein